MTFGGVSNRLQHQPVDQNYSLDSEKDRRTSLDSAERRFDHMSFHKHPKEELSTMQANGRNFYSNSFGATVQEDYAKIPLQINNITPEELDSRRKTNRYESLVHLPKPNIVGGQVTEILYPKPQQTLALRSSRERLAQQEQLKQS